MNTYRHYRGLCQNTKIYDIIALGIEKFQNEIRIPPCNPSLVKEIVQNVSADSLVTISNKYSIEQSFLGCTLLVEYLPDKPEFEQLCGRVFNNTSGIVPILRQNISDYEKELIIHDYLIQNTEYSLTANDLVRTGVGVLATGYGVCEGIAKAAKYLFDIAKIPCAIVSGTGCSSTSDDSYEPHAWNVVKIGDEWYHLDITFDLGVSGKSQRYDYFNLTDDEILRDHRITVPCGVLCKDDSLNYYVKNGLYLPKKKHLEDMLNNAYGKGLTAVQFKLPDVDDFDRAYSGLQEIVAAFMRTRRCFKGYHMSYNRKQMVFTIEFY